MKTGDRVTSKDYEEAVGHLKECMEKLGVELINDGWDPVDHQNMILRYKAFGMDGKAAGKVYGECRNRHLDAIEGAFQASNASYMAPDLMVQVQECLAGRGVYLSRKEKNPGELMSGVPEGKHEILLNCVHSSARKLYPDLVVVAFP